MEAQCSGALLCGGSHFLFKIQKKAAITCLHNIFIILTFLLKFADNIQCQDRKEKHPGLV